MRMRTKVDLVDDLVSVVVADDVLVLVEEILNHPFLFDGVEDLVVDETLVHEYAVVNGVEHTLVGDEVVVVLEDFWEDNLVSEESAEDDIVVDLLSEDGL